jgi:hypothetical protein
LRFPVENFPILNSSVHKSCPNCRDGSISKLHGEEYKLASDSYRLLILSHRNSNPPNFSFVNFSPNALPVSRLDSVHCDRDVGTFFGAQDRVSHPYKYLQAAYQKFETRILGKGVMRVRISCKTSAWVRLKPLVAL